MREELKIHPRKLRNGEGAGRAKSRVPKRRAEAITSCWVWPVVFPKRLQVNLLGRALVRYAKRGEYRDHRRCRHLVVGGEGDERVLLQRRVHRANTGRLASSNGIVLPQIDERFGPLSWAPDRKPGLDVRRKHGAIEKLHLEHRGALVHLEHLFDVPVSEGHPSQPAIHPTEEDAVVARVVKSRVDVAVPRILHELVGRHVEGVAPRQRCVARGSRHVFPPGHSQAPRRPTHEPPTIAGERHVHDRLAPVRRTPDELRELLYLGVTPWWRWQHPPDVRLDGGTAFDGNRAQQTDEHLPWCQAGERRAEQHQLQRAVARASLLGALRANEKLASRNRDATVDLDVVSADEHAERLDGMRRNTALWRVEVDRSLLLPNLDDDFGRGSPAEHGQGIREFLRRKENALRLPSRVHLVTSDLRLPGGAALARTIRHVDELLPTPNAATFAVLQVLVSRAGVHDPEQLTELEQAFELERALVALTAIEDGPHALQAAHDQVRIRLRRAGFCLSLGAIAITEVPRPRPVRVE